MDKIEPKENIGQRLKWQLEDFDRINRISQQMIELINQSLEKQSDLSISELREIYKIVRQSKKNLKLFS